MLASTTTAEYLGADELAPKAKLQKNKIKMALMPEKNNLTGLPQTLHRSSPVEKKSYHAWRFLQNAMSGSLHILFMSKF